MALCSSPGAAASTTWHELESVTVKVQNGSLPPPGGEPHVTRFKSASQVAKVTAALNSNHIAKRSPAVENEGCTGGSNVTITIVPKGAKALVLSGYLCAGKDFGSISGNVEGFLSAIGA